ncbi:MAG: hypothetical protein JKY19_11580, partial [Alcanivoracaceae bacterium]|nr:hypothetical protein [Alcanivoracaceae bacterium]
MPVDQNASYLHYGYGEDYAVQGWVDNNTPKGNLIAYDPNVNGGSNQWNTTEVAVGGLPTSTPTYDPANSNWATSGNSDYLTVGANVYYRDFASNWDTQVDAAGYTIIPASGFQVNSAAMGNQAPGFISYFEYKQGALAGSTVSALLLKNGQVNDSQSFSGERYYTSLENTGSGSPGNGLSPAGPSSLVTYPDTAASFQKSQSLYLYRYAGQALSGAITHRPVISIAIDDGFGQVNATAYVYDEKSAACDVSGNVIKYYQAKTYPGCLLPSEQKNGYKNQQYINGLVSLVISNIADGTVIKWNDGGGEQSYTATKAGDTTTINNVTTTVLQTMTLNTPSTVTLSFLYGTSEFTETYNQINTTVPMFITLPAAPINYFQMLDGVLWRTYTYKAINADFQQIATQNNTWQPYTSRAGSLTDASVANYPLKGGLILQTVKENETDGSIKTETTNYVPENFTAPTSGQAIDKTLIYYDGAGRQITAVESSTYGYQAYPSFINLHILSAVIQKVTTHNSVVTVASADAYADAINTLTVIVPSKAATFKFSSGEFAAFPFASYDPSNSATWNNWLRTNLIVVTNRHGLVVSSQDSTQVNHSILYDAENQYTIASASNAYFAASADDNILQGSTYLTGEAAYNGFESYENMTGWILSNGAVIDTAAENSISDCHTGDQSLRLPTTGRLTRSVAVTQGDQTYLVGFWYKTDADFMDDALVVSVSPSLGTTPAVPTFSNTAGDWVFQAIGITITSAPVAITVSWQNTASSDVRLDDVVIMPLTSDLGTHVYDPHFMYVTATNESPGRTSRMLRNRFHQLNSNISFSDQVTDLSVNFRSRQENASFDASIPNAKLTLKAAGAGVTANFRDGGNYARQFDFSNLASNWQVQGASIVHTNTTVDTITSTPFNANIAVETVAMYLEVSKNSNNEINQPFSISVGNYNFTWTPSTKQWTGTGPATITSVSQINNPRNILLMRGNGIVVIFSDGQFIGSYTEGVSGETITFSTGANQMKISNVMTLANPRFKVDYYDSTSKVIQTQLLAGQDAYVTQAVHDEVGRDVVVCKALPYSFQNNHGNNGVVQPVLQYRNGMLDTSTFLSALQGNGVLTGDIADFYTGASQAVQQWQTMVDGWDNPASYSFTPTDDSGYPYSRKNYEASPLARVIEKGQPGTLADGTLLAIDLTQAASARHTVQYQFGYNNNGFVLPAPFVSEPSAYTVISEIQPLKSRKVQVKDHQDIVVSVSIYNAGDNNARQHNQQYENYTSTGSTKINRSPNYFSNNPDRQSNNFETSTFSDLLGQVNSRIEADTGTSLYMYDSLGRLRFEMPDQSHQANPYIKYNCYNNLSQVVSNGTFDASTYPWSSLTTYVDDQLWPAANISKQTRVLNYGDQGESDKGPSASQLGQVTQVLTNNYRTIDAVDLTIAVTEKFNYNISSTIKSVTENITEISAAHSNPVGASDGYEVSYTYNNLQQLAAITYPENIGQSMSYSYDELGREINNQYGHNNGILADYQYTAGDNPSRLNLQAIQSNGLKNQVADINYSYVSPDLLASGAIASDENIGINVGDYSYNANGRVKSETLSFDLQKSTSTESYDYDLDRNYSYDEAVNRLTSSTDSNNPDTDISDISYDENGNIESLKEAGSQISWDFENNNNVDQRSDLLSAISSSSIEIINSESGQITQAPNNKQNSQANVISYDDPMDLVAGIAIGSQSEVTFAYGSQGQRV